MQPHAAPAPPHHAVAPPLPHPMMAPPPPQYAGPAGSQHHGGRSHQYVLPWEGCMPEERPPQDYARAAGMYASSSSPVAAQAQGMSLNAPPPSNPAAQQPHPQEQEDKSGGGDGRRSRQHRRGGERDRGPSSSDGPAPVLSVGAAAAAAGAPRQAVAEGRAPGTRHGGGGAVAGKLQHGASAGTGGSDDPAPPPPPQSRQRAHRHDHEDDQVSNTGQGQRSKHRQQGSVLGLAAAPTRRSPDLMAPWEAMDLQAPAGALPSIHGGVGLAVPQGLGAGQEGSRAPSRIGGEDDALDFAARPVQMGGGGRWAAGTSPGPGEWAGGFGFGPASSDALGPIRQPSHASGVHPAPHDTRQPPLGLGRQFH